MKTQGRVWFIIANDRHNPDRSPVGVDQWNAAPFDVRVGLTDRTGFDFLDGGCVNLRTLDHGMRMDVTRSGFGDLTLPFKYNLFGHDGGTFSSGIRLV